MQQTGFFWHVHHGELLEFCYSYDERAKYIRTNKLPSKQELRLRLFKPVNGQLPHAIVEAGKAYFETRKAYIEILRAYHKTLREVYFEIQKAYNEAWETYHDVLFNHKHEIETLHAQECPDCPWDGKTIFPVT